MSYSYEQQMAYSSMVWTWEEFDKMKQDLKIRKCRIHKKRAWAAVEWEKDYDVDVSIYRYCCLDFAEEIKKLFVDRGIFNSVRIDPNKPIKRSSPKNK
jgi:hypothetical protein